MTTKLYMVYQSLLLLILMTQMSSGYQFLHHHPPSSSSLPSRPPLSDPKTPLLVRVYKGEVTERTPVWLMRQAGRYLPEFRKFSDHLPFRQRSDTPSIATQLSLQPWQRYGMDGVIFFSDILTPLPAMGVDFDIISGKGPKIMNPLRDENDVNKLISLDSPAIDLSFTGETLQMIRNELEKVQENRPALIGFIGSPWTLAAYSIEGGHSKMCSIIKKMSLEKPKLLHQILQHYTDSLCKYAEYQIDSGAEILQVFESWAHHLNEENFLEFAKPYAEQIATFLKKKFPDIPVAYFPNGGSPFLHHLKDSNYDAIALDWRISVSRARQLLGNEKVLSGNLDPAVLYASHENIRQKTTELLTETKGQRHIFGLGHGVERDMDPESIKVLVDTVHNFS